MTLYVGLKAALIHCKVILGASYNSQNQPEWFGSGVF